MADNMATLNHKIDSLVFDCFQKSSDIILQGRRCSLEPEIVSSFQNRDAPSSFRDNTDYCNQVLKDWRVNLNSPLVLDVSLLDPESKEFYLMERWKVIYKRKDDTKDGRLSAVSRRIITLMRTLYCFVRLLPGFQLLNMCPKIPFLTFRLYNPEQPSSRNFVCESSYYDFPRIQTFRGTLYLGVRYMSASILQKILMIPPGLLNPSPESLPPHLRLGRGGPGSLRSTVPIPIPGTGTGPRTQQPVQHASSEKTQSRSNTLSVAGIAQFPAPTDLGSDVTRGVGSRNRDVSYSEQVQTPLQDLNGNQRDAAPTHSRSLDSRLNSLHPSARGHAQGRDQGEYRPGLSPQHPHDEPLGMNASLTPPPKHPQRPQSFRNQSGAGGLSTVKEQDQMNRYTQPSVAGSLASESGTSPGGGTPFYLNGAMIYPASGTSLNQKDSRFDGRSRSISASTGFTGSEAEGYVVTSSVGTGLSPPYLECSTQLMSTSPQVDFRANDGGGGAGKMERTLGAMTLYHVPTSKRYATDERNESNDLGQQNQLLLNKNSAAEGAALSLHVALPSSPFDNVTVSYDTGREMVTRMRPSSQSQVIGRFAQGSIGDIGTISESTAQLHQDGHGMRSTKGDAGRMNCFTCVEDDVRDDEDEQEPMEREEEEEDMPFAWVDHSTILSQNFDCEFKPYGDTPMCDAGTGAATIGRGAHDLNAAPRPAGSQRGSLPPSHDMPPVLMSFPDAPWSESGSLAIASAIFNQLNEYKEFRSTFPV